MLIMGTSSIVKVFIFGIRKCDRLREEILSLRASSFAPFSFAYGNKNSFICFLCSSSRLASINPHHNSSQPQVHYQKLYKTYKKMLRAEDRWKFFMHFSRAHRNLSAAEFHDWINDEGNNLNSATPCHHCEKGFGFSSVRLYGLPR